MYNIAICDDEIEEICSFCDKMERCMGKIAYNLSTFISGEELMESNSEFDIIFLDIIMDKKSGIQIGTEIKKQSITTIIIYITNMQEYMSKAFNQIHAFAYLLKPIKEDILYEQLMGAIKEITNRIRKTPEVSFSSVGKGITRVAISEIYYFEYCNRTIKLVMKNEECIYIKEKINAVADKMKKYNFAMSHQSYVVNLIYVVSISGNDLILKNGSSIPLAQKRAAEFRKLMMNFTEEFIS